MANRPSGKLCYCAERYLDIDLRIIKLFGKYLREEILNNADGVKLMAPFGSVFIAGYKKTTPKSVDHIATKKYGKVIYHFNEETDGYLFQPMHKFVRNKRPIQQRLFLYVLRPYDKLKLGITKEVRENRWQKWKQFDYKRDTYK